MVVNEDLFNNIGLDNKQKINHEDIFSKEISAGKIIINKSEFFKEKIDVFFSDYAGYSINLKKNKFSNFDSEFPPNPGIQQAFNLIKSNYKQSVLFDFNEINKYSDTYNTRMLPILKEHINLSIPEEKRFNASEYLYAEGRVHKPGNGKGPFRVFMRWLPIHSTLNGNILTRDALVVEFYDPFHLVFPWKDGIKYESVSSNSKMLKERYYKSIPESYRLYTL